MAILSLARWIPGTGMAPVWAPIHALGGLPRPDADSVLLLQARLEPDVPSDEIARYENYLNREERIRLDRFRVDVARRRFLVGRGLVRAVVGRIVDRAPPTVPLVEGEHGKPALDPRAAPNSIHFNLSHSGEIVLIAFTLRAELGIDVEEIRSGRMIKEIMDRQFHPDERAAVAREVDFFRCWALKEAVVKALGRGLGYPTASFSLAPMLRGEHEWHLELESRNWCCTELPIAGSYAAALVMEEGR